MDELFKSDGTAPPPPKRNKPGPKAKPAELDIEVSFKEAGNVNEFTVRLNSTWAEVLDWYCTRRHDQQTTVIAAGIRAHLIPMRDCRSEFEEWLKGAAQAKMDELLRKEEPVDRNPGTPIKVAP